MRKIFALILIVILLFQTVTFSSTSIIPIYLDDAKLTLSSPPVIINGTTLVPIADIVRPLGADVQWIASTRTAIINKDGIEIVINLGESHAMVNDTKIPLLLSARAINGKTMVPLKFVSESFGYNVQWNGVKREIYIDSRIQSGTKVYGDGTYKLGVDIEPGMYKVITDDMAYVGMSTDSTGNFSSLIRNDLITGSGYFMVNPTDLYVKFSRGKFFKFDYASAKPNLLSEIGSGIFLVGIDVAPGEYKITLDSDTFGYTARLSDLNGTFDSIIANEIQQGNGYIQILPTDFAIEVSGCILTPIE